MWCRGNCLARIMVVEDNALNIKLFCDLLAAHGHETEAVTDSREALETARSFKPDLVITDIQLPHVSGLELMAQIRADEELDRLRRRGRRRTHPRSGRAGLCLETDLGRQVRRDGRPAAGKRPNANGRRRFRHRPLGKLTRSPERAYLILASLKSTCLRATGSYLRNDIFSVWLRGFFLVT